jgi:hypothetical protein
MTVHSKQMSRVLLRTESNKDQICRPRNTTSRRSVRVRGEVNRATDQGSGASHSRPDAYQRLVQ